MKIDLLMLKELTRREIEVCYHVAQARTNKEIAALLYVDSRTIEAHLYTIFRKTNYRNRTELAMAVDRLLSDWEVPYGYQAP
jgi:LuxR family transcriptional regulator, positive regulator of biofilm formation